MNEKDLNLAASTSAVSEDEIREFVSHEPPAPPPAAPAPSPAAPAPAPSSAEDHDDEDADTTARVDAELAQASNDAEREAIRAKRRQERKDRDARRNERMDSLTRQTEALQRQLQEQNEQLSILRNANAGAQLSQVDAAIAQAESTVNQYKAIIADAATKGDGPTVAEATEAMITARERAQQLRGLKTRAVAHTNTPPAADPQMVKLGKQFMDENPWYKGPQDPNPDSRVLSALDNSLAAEGWDPRTPEYWSELRVRAAKYIPHRTKPGAASAAAGEQGYNGGTPQQRRQPVAGAGGNNAGLNTGGDQDYNLSAERVRAMKEAGVWDDPKRRANVIARYREADKAARS